MIDEKKNTMNSLIYTDAQMVHEFFERHGRIRATKVKPKMEMKHERQIIN